MIDGRAVRVRMTSALLFCGNSFVRTDTMKYLLILYVCSTAFGVQSDDCPLGFEHSEGDICWKVKPPETFFDKYNSCQGNDVPIDFMYLAEDILLHNEIELEDDIFWTDYVRPYDDGPYISWRVGHQTDMGIPNTGIDIGKHDPNRLCLGVRIRSAEYVAMNCSDVALRLCMVGIFFSNSSGHQHLNCPSGLYTGFASPLATCVFPSVLSSSNRNVTARLNFDQARESCSRSDAHLLHKGYIYANNYALSTKEVPLGIRRAGNDFFWMDFDEMISRDDWNFSPSEDFNVSYPNVLLNGYRWRLTGAGQIYNNILCEHFVEVPTPTMELYQRNDLLILWTDSMMDDVRCFTDSITYYPVDVTFQIENGNNEYRVDAIKNGYYWCLVVENIYYNPSKSSRVLFLKNDLVYDHYSILINITSGVAFPPSSNLLYIIEEEINYYISNMINGSLTTTERQSTDHTTTDSTSTTDGTITTDATTITYGPEETVTETYWTTTTYGTDKTNEDTTTNHNTSTESTTTNHKTSTESTTNYHSTTDENNSNTETTDPFTETIGLKNISFRKIHSNGYILLTAELIKNRQDEVEGVVMNNMPVSLKTFDFIHMRSKTECSEQEFYLSEPDTKFRRFTINETILLDNCTAFICTGDFDVGLYWEKLYDLDCSSTSQPTTEIITTTTKKPSEQVTELADSLQQIANSTSINTTQLETVSSDINKVLDFGQAVEIPRTVLEDLDTIIKKVDLPESETQVRIIQPNIAIIVADRSDSTPIVGIRVDRISEGFENNSVNTFNSDEVNQVMSNSSGTDLIVNIESVLVANNQARLSFVVFKNDNAFSHNTADSLQSINSRVLSVTIGNETMVFQKNEHIDIHLRPYKGDLTRNESKSCVFWDFDLGTNGNWSNEGCQLLKKSAVNGFDTCRCTHLTHFAEIIRFNGKVGEIDEVILSIISYVGCGLSLIGLFIIALTGTMFKSWRSEFSNKIWMHLSGAVALLMLTFLIISTVKFDSGNKAACVVFGVFLHYSLLASFCWMLISAVLSYKRLVTVFSRNSSHRLLKSCLFGWLTPLVPIIIMFSVSSNPYPGNWEVPNLNRKFCFPDKTGFWLAIFMPVALIVLANTFLFFMIIYSVFISTSIQRHGDTKQVYRSLTVSFLLFFLFGISWVFGLFMDNIVLTYLFCLTTTIQGFILFMFFILGNKKTRDMWCVSLGIKDKKTTTLVTSTASTTKKSFSTEKNVPMTNVNRPRSLSGNSNNFDARFS